MWQGKDSDALLENRILDSLGGVSELVGLIKPELLVGVGNDELVSENIQTVDWITAWH